MELSKMTILNKFLSFALSAAMALTAGQAAFAQSTSSQSAEEVAKSLSNPNTPLASLNFENGFTWYKGSLPGADTQTSYSLLFQPVLPFPIDNQGTTIFWRPAVPFLFDQPVYDVARGDFRDATFGIGDIGFDLGIGRTEKNGFLWAFGTIVTLPTATNKDFAGKQFRMGPEMLVGQMSSKGIIVLFPSHQWDVAGWSDKDYSVSSAQLGGVYFLGGGATIGSLPKLSYDWVSQDWTIPINLTFSQTIVTDGQPIKHSLAFDYYVEQRDAFGPDFMFRYTLTPVVENPLANLVQR
jgi:hypothetical protein